LRVLQEELQTQGARDVGYDVPYSTIHVGKMASGTALNIVPDQADLLFEFRNLAEDDPDLLEEKIKNAAQSIAEGLSGTGEIGLTSYAAYPGLATPVSDTAVRRLQNWSGGEICKVAFGTEGGILSDLGIPTLVCGPGSMAGQGHKADEFVSRVQLMQCARMLERALASLT
jgi:acetylornithine deacetylase